MNALLSPFNLVPILAAAVVAFWVFYVDKTKPGSSIAAFVHHRDRIWFALMLLLVPFMLSQFLFSFFRPLNLEERRLIGIISALFSGAVYGTAACLFASPGKRLEPFSFWMAFIVAFILIFFSWAARAAVISFRNPSGGWMPFIFAEGVLVLCYFVWRMARGNKPDTSPDAPAPGGEEKKDNPGRVFLWLLVALAPIPLLLIMASVSAKGPNPALGPILILSPHLLPRRWHRLSAWHSEFGCAHYSRAFFGFLPLRPVCHRRHLRGLFKFARDLIE